MLTLSRLDFDISRAIALRESFDYIRIRERVKRSNRFLATPLVPLFSVPATTALSSCRVATILS